MILVVGTGRSGTSTVARLLHEKCGINMGTKFRLPDEQNPKGYYEDLNFRNLNDSYLRNKIRLVNFVENIFKLIEKKEEPWGLKDPRLTRLLPHYITLMPEYKIIRCQRNEDDVIKSCIKCYSWPYASARSEIETREKLLNLFLAGKRYLTINFTERVEEQIVLNQIKEFVNGKKCSGN